MHASYLNWALEENDKKWNTIGLYVWPNPEFYDSYHEVVELIYNWFSE